MNRQKFFLFPIALIIFFCCAQLHAKEYVNWISPENTEFSLQWGYSFPIKGDLRNPAPSEDFIVAADFGELRINAGLKYQLNQFDFTNRIFYMPTFFKTFQAGFGLTQHLYRYFDVFTEYDAILAAHLRWVRGPVFSCEIGPGLFVKFASIDSIRENQPYIYNFSYSFEFLCKWQIKKITDFWCSLYLQDYFDFPLAISPFFKAGFDYQAVPGLVFGIDYSLKYIDMFFSAVYQNESILRFSVKVSL